jgi:hypothetical protein
MLDHFYGTTHPHLTFSFLQGVRLHNMNLKEIISLTRYRLNPPQFVHAKVHKVHSCINNTRLKKKFALYHSSIEPALHR